MTKYKVPAYRKGCILPIKIRQNKALRLITFSPYDEHSTPLFRNLNILRLHDLVEYCIAVFMYKFKNDMLLYTFKHFLIPVNQVHKYNTRSATKDNYLLPKVRTNYGKFNIRFSGPVIWNSIDNSVKSTSLKKFRRSIKIKLLDSWTFLEFYFDFSLLS